MANCGAWHTPFSATSRTQGGVASEIGVAQDLRSIGLAGTMGMGLAGLSNLGDEYRGRVPESSVCSTTSTMKCPYMILGLNMGAGFQLTDRLSVGATMTLGTGFEQLAFIGPIAGSAMVNAYALRGTFGVNYELNDCNTLGFYYQSKMSFDFPNAVRVGSNYQDINIAQPTTLGLGIANRSPDGRQPAACGRRLLQALGRRRPLARHDGESMGRGRRHAAHPRQDEVPAGIFLQQQPHEPQCGNQL